MHRWRKGFGVKVPRSESRLAISRSIGSPFTKRTHNTAKMANGSKFSHLPLSTSGPQSCALEGTALLSSPYLNKGSAFPQNERDEFQLNGLLPSKVNTLDEQVKRAYDQYNNKRTDLGKNTFMTSMKEQNEVLYYRLIQDHLKEMLCV